MSALTLLLAILGSAVLVMIGMWIYARAVRNATAVDLAWGLSLAGAAGAAGIFGEGDPWRRAAIAGLGVVWAVRLAWHLGIDRLRRHAGEEDGRYAELRERKGDGFDRWLFGFFLLQAVVVAVFAVPFIWLAQDPRAFGTPWDVLGLALGLVAIAGESLADRQLARWRQDPANVGKTCRQGLWRYSRHPNYFFEWLHWLAYPLIAIGAAPSLWWAALIVPPIELLLLTRVTGIPATEKRALVSRGDDYRRYQATTSPFIPWFPRPEAAVERSVS